MENSKYWLMAFDCLEMAKQAKPETRGKLQQIAELWLSLAADKFDKASEEVRRARPCGLFGGLAARLRFRPMLLC
jgi:hypothetical protein